MPEYQAIIFTVTERATDRVVYRFRAEASHGFAITRRNICRRWQNGWLALDRYALTEERVYEYRDFPNID